MNGWYTPMGEPSPDAVIVLSFLAVTALLGVFELVRWIVSG